MTDSATDCSMQEFVDRHFAGKLPPMEERRLRTHLPGCVLCDRRYRRQLLWARFDRRALSRQERLARGLGLAGKITGARWSSPRVLAPALAVIGALLLVMALPNLGSPAFQARGTSGPAATEVWAYRITAEGSAPLGDSMGQYDELAFAYFVPAEAEATKYLLVFAVDEHRRVYWYHPAWTDPDGSPQAIPVAAGRHELPEAVAHQFRGRDLTLYAVFVASPVSVWEVEKAISSGSAEFTGQVQWQRRVRVNR